MVNRTKNCIMILDFVVDDDDDVDDDKYANNNDNKNDILFTI